MHGSARLWLVLVVVAMLALAGCSSTSQAGIATAGGAVPPAGGSAEPSPASTDVEEQRLAFAACMRDNAVPMPDPDGERGGGFRALTDVDPDVLEAALAACESLRPRGGGRGTADLSEADKQKMLEMAACLRDEGYEVPDPTFDGQGGFLRGRAGSGIDPRDEGFREAAEACRTEVGLDFGPGSPRGATQTPSTS